MPNPTPNNVHINQPLTDLSVAYFRANADKYVATRLFPTVGVQKKSDSYYVYDRGDLLRSEAKYRAPGAEAAIGAYKISSSNYSCDRYAIGKDIDDPTRMNADPQFDLDTEAVEYCSDMVLKARDQEFVSSFFAAGTWSGCSNSSDMTGQSAPSSTTSNFLQWNDVASTPIEDIHGEMDAAEGKTGFRPNKLALGPRVRTNLINHPDIIDRIKYTGQGGFTTDQILAQLFGVKEIVTLRAVVNSAAEGAADSVAFMAGKSALLLYVPESAGLRTPSAGYTFVWTGGGSPAQGAMVKRYRLERNESDRVEAESWFDHVKVAGDLGCFFASAVA